MVSALIAAAAEGCLENVVEILGENSIDINGKDEQGATAIVEAVKNGHVEVVQALLEKGADPALALNHTQDLPMLELLNQCRTYQAQSQEKLFYPPAPLPGAPAGFPYYQPHPLPEGAVFYPPPPHDPHHTPNPAGGPGNLPPPEIARLIPCRYFPACRYGSSCIFAHPQGPYFQGPLPPPAQYPAPYDPMSAQNYSPSYYPMSPPSFQPPPTNGVPMNTLPSSPPPPMSQAPPSSEISSPPPPFTPNGAPVQLPYQPMVGPSPYPPHPGQPGTIPMARPPVQHVYHPTPPHAQPQSPPAMYNGTHNGASAPGPFVIQPSVISPYAGPVPVPYSDSNTASLRSPPLNPQPDNFPPGPPPPRDHLGLNRRGGARRGSFGGRPRPPCLFFPTGKCKNGDDCRFPHILSESTVITQQYFSSRGGAPRAPRAHLNGHTSLEQKMSNLSVRDAPRPQNGNDSNSKSDNRTRHGFGHRNLPGNAPQQPNGKRPSLPKQRLPNADDFPVLTGSTSPPSSKTINGYFGHVNGQNGPTAAQVLQAPRPTKSTSSSVTRTASPDSTSSAKDFKAEVGVAPTLAANEQSVKPALASKLPISFAAVTASAPTATNNVPEAPVEVSVSA